MTQPTTPYDHLLKRVRDEKPPPGVARADWHTDVDTLLGLERHELGQRINRRLARFLERSENEHLLLVLQELVAEEAGRDRFGG
jgi:hypothetical protein